MNNTLAHRLSRPSFLHALRVLASALLIACAPLALVPSADVFSLV